MKASGPQRSIGREAAIALAQTNWWVGKPAREVALIQMHIAECCMPFDLFQGALEEALGRPVYTHELALSYDRLLMELTGEADAPSLEDIINLIPANKRIVIEP